MSEEKLARFLETGKDWSRIRTRVAGVFVLKLPPCKSFLRRIKIYRSRRPLQKYY